MEDRDYTQCGPARNEPTQRGMRIAECGLRKSSNSLRMSLYRSPNANTFCGSGRSAPGLISL